MKSLSVLTLLIVSLTASTQTISSDQPDKATLLSAISKNTELSGQFSPEVNALVARQTFSFFQDYFKDDRNTYASIYPLIVKVHSDMLASIQVSKRPPIGTERARAIVDSTLFEYHGHFPSNDFDRQVSVRSVVSGKDSNTLYSVGGDGRFLKWEIDTRKSEELYQSDDLHRILDISFDEKWALLSTNIDGLKLLDLEKGKLKPLPFAELKRAVYDALFLPNSYEFMMVGSSSLIMKTSPDKNQLSSISEELPDKMLALSIHPDNNLLAIGSARGEVILLDLADDNQIHEKLERFNANELPIRDLEFSPDGKLLAVGGFNFNNGYGYVQVFDLRTKEQIGLNLTGFTAPVNQVKFSTDGNYIAAASNDKTARVWDINQLNKAPLVIDNAHDWVWAINFANDNQALFTASADGKIRINNLDVGENANELCSYINRNLTQKEWDFFFGSNIPWQETCPGKL